MNIVEVKHLSKQYKEKKAVDDLSFVVEEGEILGLLGPNGSGKSTTINCLLSLLNYQNGEIKIFDKPMKVDAYDIKAKIGVVFQEVAVFQELNVYDNIDYFCGLYIKDKNKRKEMINDAIKLCGLEEYTKFLPKQLSGGLLRRLNIACGVAHQPKLIFLDEPTVAVDPQSRNHILEGIKTLRNLGATIIYTTHYMEEVEQICDRIIILDKGKLLAQGSCEELRESSIIKEKIMIECFDIKDDLVGALNKLEGVNEVIEDHHLLTICFSDHDSHLPLVMDLLKEKHVKYQRVYSQRPTLNDVFLQLTGKQLRDS